VTVSPSRRKPNLDFRLLPDDADARGEDAVAFLRARKAHLGGPTTVARDRCRIQGRSRLVKAYLAKDPEILAEDSPRYAPEANPDEGVWGWPSPIGCRATPQRMRPG